MPVTPWAAWRPGWRSSPEPHSRFTSASSGSPGSSWLFMSSYEPWNQFVGFHPKPFWEFDWDCLASPWSRGPQAFCLKGQTADAQLGGSHGPLEPVCGLPADPSPVLALGFLLPTLVSGSRSQALGLQERAGLDMAPGRHLPLMLGTWSNPC